MRTLLFALLIISFQACGSSSSPGEAAEATLSVDPPTTVSEPAPQDPPCTTFTSESVAEALRWDGANEGMPTEMRDGRIQSCYFSSTDNTGAVTITISRSSERTIERKGLERAFTTNLATVDGKLTWREISANLGDQAIYGTGKTGPSHTYRVEWRQGNDIQYTIDASYYKQLDDEEVLNRILLIAERL